MQAMPPADDSHEFPDEATFFASNPAQIPGFDVPYGFVEHMLGQVHDDRLVRDHAVSNLMRNHGAVPPISASFVQRTLEALRADGGLDAMEGELKSRDISLNESAVEDLLTDEPFPLAWLEAHITPPATDGFVERTLQRVTAQRSADDQDFASALQEFTTPKPSATFVVRTLAAIQSENPAVEMAAAGSEVGLDTTDSNAFKSTPRTSEEDAGGGKVLRFASWVAAAAALFVVALLVFDRFGSSDSAPFQPQVSPLQARSAVLNAPHSAASYGPAVFATLFGRSLATNIPAAEDGLILAGHGIPTPTPTVAVQGR